MASRWYTLVIDASDVRRLADFWTQVLDWQVVYESDDEMVIAKDENTYPAIIFGTVPEAKSVKNRLHIDLNPDDQDAEVERLIVLGATRAEVGQSKAAEPVRWVVLADPEDNEFCVLTAREQ
jgi:predicted enzyme related to lactoylglutathione lyase